MSAAVAQETPPTIVLDTVVVRSLGGVPLPPSASDLTPVAPGGQAAQGGRLGILGNRETLSSPFSVSAYTGRLAQDQQARSVADVASNDASVQRIVPATGYRDAYTIRGLNFFTFNTAFNGLLGLAPKQRILPELAERIEVLKGPSTFLYGVAPGGTAGGLINIVPKRAGDEPITQATVGYTSDANFGTHVDIGRRLGAEGEFGVRLTGVLRGGNLAIDSTDERLGTAVLGLDYRADRLRIEADLGTQRQKVDAPDWYFTLAPQTLVPPVPDGRASLSAPWASFETEDAFAVTRAEYDLSDDWTAFGAVGIATSRTDGLFPFVANLLPNGDFLATPRTFPSGGRQVSGEAGLRGAFETGPVSHALTVVGSLWDQDNKAGGSILRGTTHSNIFDPVRLPKPDTRSAVFFDDLGTTADNRFTALSVADTLSVLDERIQLILGGRLQRVHTRSLDGVTGALRSEYDEREFTPAIGLVLRPLETVSFYGNYVESLDQGPTATAGTVNAGAAFRPIVTEQIEAGVKAEWSGLTATLGVFEIRVPNGLTDFATNVFSVDGEQRNRGVEFNLYGEPVEGVRLLGGVAFIDGELTRTAGGRFDGNTAIGVPSHRITVGAEWDLPFVPDLTVSGRVVHTASQFVNVANTQQIPDWTRLDFGARYTFRREGGGPIVLRASVQNVLDTNYWASASAGQVSGISRGAPRTVLLSSTFNF